MLIIEFTFLAEMRAYLMKSVVVGHFLTPRLDEKSYHTVRGVLD